MQDTQEQDVIITDGTKKVWNALSQIDYNIALNNDLIRSQEVKHHDIIELFKLHAKKLNHMDSCRTILQDMARRGVVTPSDAKVIDSLNDDLTQMEFMAQRVWGFSESEDFHIWWLDTPGCCCPTMDNIERQGIPGNIYRADCPWHGGFKTKESI